MRDLYIKNGHGFVLMYSVGAESTFECVDDLYTQIVRISEVMNQRKAVVLVASKCDLEGSLRLVSEQQGRAKAGSWGIEYIEASAKAGINVNETFNAVLRQLMKQGSNINDLNKKKTRKNRQCAIL